MRKRTGGGGVTEVTDITADLEQQIMSIQQFPMDIFPKEFQRFVKNVATSIKMEPGLIASIALTILSGVVGNTVTIRAKKRTYGTTPFLWLVIIAKSGEGKTPALRTLMYYLEELQSTERQAYDQLDKEEKRNATLKRYFIDDHTVAALADIFEKNPRGTIIRVDEISRLIADLDKHKNTGTDRERYLELFNGGPWTIDRKGISRHIPNTGAAILGGIQPKILPKVFRDESFENGLFPRFLVYPMERQALELSSADISDDDTTYWEQLVDKCYNIPLRRKVDAMNPRLLRLDGEAFILLQSFYNRRGKEIDYLPDDRPKVFMSKLISYYILKFAGMLHIIRAFNKADVLGFVIDKKTIEDAIKLTNFFAGQMRKTLQLYGEEDQFTELERDLLKTVHDLEHKIVGGKLKLTTIAKAYKERLPESLKVDSVHVSSMLRKMGLETGPGTNNYKCLIWEPDKLHKLFTKARVTTVTPVTQASSQNDITDEPKRIRISAPKKRN